MRTFIFPILLLAGVAGCATTSTPEKYGSFVTGTSPANEKIVVDDVMKRLVTTYPPAHTRLDLQHVASDAFGTVLVASMRAKGYALGEYKAQAAVAVAMPAGAYTFAYVFDQPAGTDLYRVTLLVNNQALSRVYETKGGAIVPAGYWVRKE
ncbi:conjugal transfer protein TrbH [Massilia psychrophila]|uniref:Conjugal transfer protein TrbH n=1 Tax=Massilia psychrophila TaxID=1603353 RepID=A0A2G8SYJ4_9BURK|nr:conjugal transfer protein TrbH [Massilia psychrophila]PIL38870.1 conjugal transfer protein TrbH [Massilia psychrophila]GGE90357.1 hypothetical protein GCM10008020_39240 [Massilia psychrophila]